MMIGARTAAWAKSGYTAKDYVQDGLIHQWDGIENVGFAADGYQHNPNATVWKDLVGTNDMSLEHSGFFTNDALDYNDASASCLYPHVPMETMEVVCSQRISGTKLVCLNSGDPDNNYIDSRGLYFNINASHGYGVYFDGSKLNSAIVPMDINDVSRHSFCAQWLSFNGQTDKIYLDGKNIRPTSYHSTNWSSKGKLVIGGRSETYPYQYGGSGQINSLRIYNRILTAAEIAANYAIDKARFNLTDAA